MTQERLDERGVPDRDQVFAVFLRAHWRGVERRVQFRLGEAQGGVDDVCQMVFVAALQQFHLVRSFEDRLARAWLLRVADRRCVDEFRSRGRRARVYRRVAADPVLDEEDPFDDVYLDRLDGDGEAAERVRVVLAALSDTHRRVLELDLEGPLTGRQMAAALGTTEVAGRLRLMRARRAFSAEFARRFGWLGGERVQGGSDDG